MADYTIYVLAANSVSISGSGDLSGYDQGNGSQLQDLEITLTSSNWEPINITDADTDFADSDTGQTLDGTQFLGADEYTNGSVVEAEYSITVEDPDGNEYVLLGFNINQSGTGHPAYGTVEGLAFVGGAGGFPPQNVVLEVKSTSEGPSEAYTALATPVCFTPGCLIQTPIGEVDVTDLAVGDKVNTKYNGTQTIRWIGRAFMPAAVLNRKENFRPTLIKKDALGPNKPSRDMMLSPNHKLLISSWQAELYFGQPEVLVPVKKLKNDMSIHAVNDGKDVDYYHILFDDYEVIYCNGLPCESLLPNAMHDALDEHIDLFPKAKYQNALVGSTIPMVMDKTSIMFNTANA